MTTFSSLCFLPSLIHPLILSLFLTINPLLTPPGVSTKIQLSIFPQKNFMTAQLYEILFMYVSDFFFFFCSLNINGRNYYLYF